MFKLKQSANGKKLIEKLLGRSEWGEAGPQWQGLETELQLSGWSKAPARGGATAGAAPGGGS